MHAYCGIMVGKNIRVTAQTVELLQKAKIHPRETYDDILRRLLQ